MARKKSAPVETTSRFEPLTEGEIKAQTDSGSFSRGRAYFREGRIRDTVLREKRIEALCEGSDVLPYRVESSLPRLGEPEGSLLYASCTCPRGGFCKHLVALLLTWIHNPERFVGRPPVADLLGERSREDLIALIERMVQRYPDLERLVELPVPVITAGGFANELSIDPAVIRRHAQSAFAQVDSYTYDYEWGDGGAIPGAADVYSLLELGQRYAAAGQWANAQAVFTNLAEETGDTILHFPDDEGQLMNVVTACDAGLAAGLDAQAELPEGERLNEELRERLIQALYNIWRFDVFEADAMELAQKGPGAIARNVTGEERAMVEGWLKEEQPIDWQENYVTGFQVLLRENSGLDDEGLLRLYREVEYWNDVAALLVRMDRVDEAVAVAGRHLTEPFNLIGFANTMIQRGGDHIGRALSLVDDRAWEVEGTNAMHDAVLQEWLVDQFSRHDRPKEALAMAERRFKRQPMLHTWQAVRDAAGLPGQEPNAWAEIRPKLHDHLQAQKAWTVLVDVHLEDGDVAAALDAFAKVGKQPRSSGWHLPGLEDGDQHLRMAEAAERDFPDEAVAIYRQQAESLIGHRQRTSYQVAATHLARAKETLEQHGRADEWQAIIAGVRTSHKTLRALREELDALDLG